jgi:hypothetical protein
VIWNWDNQSSNYTNLKQAGFAKNGGLGWLTEATRPTSSFELTDNLIQVAQQIPDQSGYGDGMGMGAVEEATADADKLLGNINPAALWITRLHAELPRAALGKDLEVGASITQTPVSNFIQTSIGIGTPPPCLRRIHQRRQRLLRLRRGQQVQLEVQHQPRRRPRQRDGHAGRPRRARGARDDPPPQVALISTNAGAAGLRARRPRFFTPSAFQLSLHVQSRCEGTPASSSVFTSSSGRARRVALSFHHHVA